MVSKSVDLEFVENQLVLLEKLDDDDRAHHLSGLRNNHPAEFRLIEAVLKEWPACLREDENASALFSQAPAVRERIAHFSVIKRIGKGGMAEVFLCKNEKLNFRIEAIKQLHGLANKRFEELALQREIKALSSLKSPHIVKIYDCGKEPDGLVWFSMEYLEGVPICDFADTHYLNVRERVGLVAQAAEGLKSAHRKAVLHRDLKPSNILVEEGTPPLVKLIDFGISHFLGEENSLHCGTFGYMSPEQMAGGTLDVRSDVYSLGVVLYELLTGRPYFEVSSDSDPGHVSDPLEEDEGLLVDPFFRPRPSETVDRLVSVGQVEKRQATAPGLKRQLKGELDAIVAKAIAFDPEARYQSVADFEKDLKHYLRRERVSAVPNNPLYSLRVWSRTHPLVTVAGLAALLVLGFLSTGFFVVAEKERLARAGRHAAENQRKEAEAGYRYIASLLAAPHPNRFGSDVSYASVLEDGERRLAADLEISPPQKARLFLSMGSTWHGLGRFSEAERCYLHIEKLDEDYGLPLEWSVHGINRLGALYTAWSCFPEAERLFLSAYEKGFGHDPTGIMRAMLGSAQVSLLKGNHDAAFYFGDDVVSAAFPIAASEPELFLDAVLITGNALREQGRYYEAAGYFNWALGVADDLVIPLETKRWDLIFALAQVELARGKPRLAQEQFQKVLEWRSLKYPANHARVLDAEYELARSRLLLGDIDSALELLEQVLKVRRTTFGIDDQETLRVFNAYLVALSESGKSEKALAFFQDPAWIFVVEAMPHGPEKFRIINNLGDFLMKEGAYEQALSLLSSLSVEKARFLGESHPSTLISLATIGEVYLAMGKPSSAFSQFERVLALHTRSHPLDSHGKAVFESLCGAALIPLARFEDAERFLLAAHAEIGVNHGYRKQVRAFLVELYNAWGRPEEGRKYIDEVETNPSSL